MPLLTRWYIRTSFVYFIVALLFRVILGVQAFSAFNPLEVNLNPIYIHLLAEGWITMLIIGVAFWMFPKFSQDRPRRSESLGWACYILLNAGLLLRIISEPMTGAAGIYTSFWAVILVAAALLQWLGGMAFVVNTWSRVKEK